MRIVIAGKNDVAVSTAELISRLHPDSPIWGVYCESELAPLPGMRNFGNFLLREQTQIQPVSIPNTGMSKNFAEQMRVIQPDLIISAQFSVIVPLETVEAFKNRILNIHFGPLPAYRGVAPISHAVMRSEPMHGVSLHLIDSGIDTGPVVETAMFDIVGLDNRAVYSQCTHHGVRLVERNWGRIREAVSTKGELESISKTQDHRDARYFSKGSFNYQDSILKGDCSARQAHQFVLAYTFPPLSRAHVVLPSGARIAIDRAEPLYSLGLCKVAWGTLIPDPEHPRALRIATRDCWVRLHIFETQV